MAFRSVIVLLMVAGYSYSASVSTRILGSKLTTIDHYPSLVQVEYFNTNSGTWGQSCAASILTSRHLLSAAHCFSGSFYLASFSRIRAGSTYRHTDGQVIYVNREIVHPSYDQSRHDGDIVVVELLSVLEYNPLVQQATIIVQGAELPEHSVVVHAGWGSFEETGPSSDQLRDATLYIINSQFCRDNYAEVNTEVTDNMICAGIPEEGGIAACQGDAGGPLYYDNILVGIISYGYGCGDPKYPGISTKVSSYTDWIVDTVEQL